MSDGECIVFVAMQAGMDIGNGRTGNQSEVERDR